ncbi:MAG: tRNA (adenosine(37)-N6)-dimethylallyltransferase MiaA [Rhodomicrobium sp.]
MKNLDAVPRPAVLIAGPTASGKTAFALELAKEFGGVIINADSMQVYAELRIITNRPTPEEEAAAPHRLYGFRPASEAYSTALWLAHVAAELNDAPAREQLPILVGGTGLYFKALTEGLSAIPSIPSDIRDHYRRAAQKSGADALHAELTRRDPATASRLRPTDTQRLVRALEVLEGTGRPLSDWQVEKQPPLLPLSQTYPISLMVERDELYKRCDARFDAMLNDGVIEEARSIEALALSPALPAMRAVGLPPLLAYLRRDLSLEEAGTAAKTATRNYAKRQLTWIRNNFITWKSSNEQEKERTKSEINRFIKYRLTSAR